ncbi:MAG TPA: TonB family protein [Polyangiaceae bacterium]|jgi:TonB family protein
MTSRTRIGLFLAFCVSLGLHGVAYASLSAEHRVPPRPAPVSQMNFELPPLVSKETEPEPPNQVVAAAKPEPAHTPASKRAPSSAPTPTSAAAPTHAPALDLSGVTLTNDTGADFSVPVGDGSPLRGPIGLGANRAQASAPASAATSAAKPPPLVAVGDLSEHPRAPSLASLLRANYPTDARERGLRGSASLRARIDADGVIRSARLLAESSAGFGSACRRTVLGSHWSAPRDKNGSAVATEIVYTCHFEVDQ